MATPRWPLGERPESSQLSLIHSAVAVFVSDADVHQHVGRTIHPICTFDLPASAAFPEAIGAANGPPLGGLIDQEVVFYCFLCVRLQGGPLPVRRGVISPIK